MIFQFNINNLKGNGLFMSRKVWIIVAKYTFEILFLGFYFLYTKYPHGCVLYDTEIHPCCVTSFPEDSGASFKSTSLWKTAVWSLSEHLGWDQKMNHLWAAHASQKVEIQMSAVQGIQIIRTVLMISSLLFCFDGILEDLGTNDNKSILMTYWFYGSYSDFVVALFS